jgi:ferritin
MLSAKMVKALNNQISEEVYASHYYLDMASWCDKSGLRGSAAFLYAHAEQERQHMLKLFHYVNDAGGHAVVQAVKQPSGNYKSISDIFGAMLKHERFVTKCINDLVEICLEEKDYSTFNFLQWYVAEQHEEERLLNSILDLIKIAGVEGRGLFLIDKEIEKYSSKA